MNGYWQNLRPFEKRVVVGIGALFFLILNMIFVFPHFSDWGSFQERTKVARKKLGDYQTEVARTNEYVRAIKTLEGEGGDVAAEDQSWQFNNTVNSQAGQSGVKITSGGTIKTSTNQFFVEKSMSINVEAGEQQLVDFLYNLGSGANSQIRVRGLNVHPLQPARQLLAANITLIASYQKKPPVRTAAPVRGATVLAPTSPPPTRLPVPAKSATSTPKRP